MTSNVDFQNFCTITKIELKHISKLSLQQFKNLTNVLSLYLKYFMVSADKLFSSYRVSGTCNARLEKYIYLTSNEN